MIIWSGFGILLPVAFFIGMLLPYIFELPLPKEWKFALGVIAGTVFSWLFALTIARTKIVTLLDPKTRLPVSISSRHTLFFIPVRFYCWLATIISILVVAAAATGNLEKDPRKARGGRSGDDSSGDVKQTARTETKKLLTSSAQFPIQATTHGPVSGFSDTGVSHIPSEETVVVSGFNDGRYTIKWKNRELSVAEKDLATATYE